MLLTKQKVFKDPLYGFIHVDHVAVKKIIDSSVFQRLRRIRQLSGVQMVFHGAEHSRFSHSLGVYEVAYRFLEIPDLKNNLNKREQLLFLIAALLHDIGHGAYSHTFEAVFGVDHEKVGAGIIVTNQEIRQILDEIDSDFAEDVASIILKNSRYPLIEQLISSQLDADRLDYLERDAYFTGAAYGRVDLDRIIRVLKVKDGRVVFKVSGIHAIESYLISRYHMYWQVYYHPVARAYEVNLEKIFLRLKHLIEKNYSFAFNLAPIKKIIENPDDLRSYLMLDDFYVNGLISSLIYESDEILSELSKDFINRKIWKYLNDDQANEEEINRIIKQYNPSLRPYYLAKRTVENSTYKDFGESFGEKIYILLENGEVSSLKEQSKIIDSLLQSGTKKDPKFFYRP